MDINKPEIDFPEGAPPKDLEITDVWVGDGKVAGPATPLTCITSASPSPPARSSTRAGTGASRCASSSGSARSSPAGDQGVQGMKVGGRRKLVIPPGLAYGDRGAPGAIKPGETLIFVCDLIAA